MAAITSATYQFLILLLFEKRFLAENICIFMNHSFVANWSSGYPLDVQLLLYCTLLDAFLFFGSQKRSMDPACMTLIVNICSWQPWTQPENRDLQMWPHNLLHSLVLSGTQTWTTLASSPQLWSSRCLHFLDHRESEGFWWHTSPADVLFSLDQWLYQWIVILTDCLTIAGFSQNKHPLANSLVEGPAHMCSTNRPHQDGVPVSLHLLLAVHQPVKQMHLQKTFKDAKGINLQS